MAANKPTAMTLEKTEVLGKVQQLIQEGDKTAMQAIQSMLADSCATEPVTDNITNMEERRKLLSDYIFLLFPTEAVDAATVSLFMLCQIDRLRELVADAKSSESSLASLEALCNAAGTIAIRFMAKGTSSSTPNSTAPNSPKATEPAAGPPVLSSSPLRAPPMNASDLFTSDASTSKRKAASPAAGRSPTRMRMSSESAYPTTRPGPSLSAPSTPPSAAQRPRTEVLNKAMRKRWATYRAYRRDNHACILSGYGYPDAAHIFPFSVSKDQQTSRLMMDMLAAFWGEDAAKVWRSQCETEGITESPKNLLCLSKHMHTLWGAARFGLKPLRDPLAAAKNEVWLQFHWLRKSLFRPNDILESNREDRLLDYIASKGLDHGFAESASHGGYTSRGRNGTLAHRQSGLPIETGQVFIVAAEDPADLPSLDLLELQWHLIRLAAMCGAADMPDNAGQKDGGAASRAVRAVGADDDVDSLTLGDGMDEAGYDDDIGHDEG